MGGGGLMATIAQGMAFGTGSAIAHRAVGAVAGAMSGSGGEAAPAAAAPAAAAASTSTDCSAYQRDFSRCIKEVGSDPCACMWAVPVDAFTRTPPPSQSRSRYQNKNDIGACQMYMDSFDQCQSAGARLM
jgi:hypothetical protein